MARLMPMNAVQETMLHTANWLENSFPGHCMLLDLDFTTGALTLFGHDCATFRSQFNRMVEGVYNG